MKLVHFAKIFFFCSELGIIYAAATTENMSEQGILNNMESIFTISQFIGPNATIGYHVATDVPAITNLISELDKIRDVFEHINEIILFFRFQAFGTITICLFLCIQIILLGIIARKISNH